MTKLLLMIFQEKVERREWRAQCVCKLKQENKSLQEYFQLIGQVRSTVTLLASGRLFFLCLSLIPMLL